MEEATIALPTDVRELLDQFEIVEASVRRDANSDVIFSQLPTEEMREQSFYEHLYAAPHLDSTPTRSKEDVGIAEALIKVSVVLIQAVSYVLMFTIDDNYDVRGRL